jgi:hypothetical protein
MFTWFRDFYRNYFGIRSTKRVANNRIIVPQSSARPNPSPSLQQRTQTVKPRVVSTVNRAVEVRRPNDEMPSSYEVPIYHSYDKRETDGGWLSGGDSGGAGGGSSWSDCGSSDSGGGDSGGSCGGGD